MTIVAVQFAGLTVTDSWSDGQYHYTAIADWRLMHRADGRLERVEGLAMEKFKAEGFTPSTRCDLHYDEGADGGGPSLVEVNAAVARWLADCVTAQHQEWVGRELVEYITKRKEDEAS